MKGKTMKSSEIKYKKMLKVLKARGGVPLMSKDGKKVYVITKESDGQEAVAILESDIKLTFMSDEELDQFIAEKLKEG